MKMKTLLLLATLCFSTALRADILVIVNTQNPLASINHRQVVDLFMGRVSGFPNGQPAQVLDLPSGNRLRASFYRALTGRSEAQVDAYWATLVFAGRMSPPRQLPNDQALVEAVANTPSAIAYVSRQPLPASVKVLMELSSD